MFKLCFNCGKTHNISILLCDYILKNSSHSTFLDSIMIGIVTVDTTNYREYDRFTF